MITETVVSFETAKLLKEKEFDECPLFHYLDTGQLWIPGGYDKTKKWHFPAPTLQMVMKWLREAHHLHIIPEISDVSRLNPQYYVVVWLTTPKRESYILELFDSYEEACEAAIVYCLKNLI